MSKDWVVKVEGLSKKFGMTLKRAMRYGVNDSLRRMTGMKVDTETLRPGEFWALKDVSFELESGDALGIMGVNGSGKTTLLRILNGTYRPDAGRAVMKGRVGSMIAAGAGFSPVLTGRENIYVNGTIMGLSPNEIDRKFHDIVDFADLGDFIDMPVRHYSSGMSVRLGFAVAAFSDPEVLLVDEVLAVGDLAFQKKCYDFLHTLKRRGTTILLVSHSIGAIWAVCNRSIFIDKGQVKVVGDSEKVVKAYEDQNYKNAESSMAAPEDNEVIAPESQGVGDVVVRNVRVLDSSGSEEVRDLEMGQGFCLEAEVEVVKPIENPLFRYTIDAIHYKFICVLDSYEEGLPLDYIEPGNYKWLIKVPWHNFRPGAYSLNLAVCKKSVGVQLFFAWRVATFRVNNPKERFLYADQNSVMHLETETIITRDN